nr:hypothetical protein Itr_chr07CG15110 [Ipomoea trifida]
MEVWNLPTGHCCRCLTGAMETGRQHGSETAMEMTSRTHGGVAAGGVTDSRHEPDSIQMYLGSPQMLKK